MGKQQRKKHRKIKRPGSHPATKPAIPGKRSEWLNNVVEFQTSDESPAADETPAPIEPENAVNPPELREVNGLPEADEPPGLSIAFEQLSPMSQDIVKHLAKLTGRGVDYVIDPDRHKEVQ